MVVVVTEAVVTQDLSRQQTRLVADAPCSAEHSLDVSTGKLGAAHLLLPVVLLDEFDSDGLERAASDALHRSTATTRIVRPQKKDVFYIVLSYMCKILICM